jgi:D-glycero-beta-D-manno-heptose 1-phosphate adenylyltransferase
MIHTDPAYYLAATIRTAETLPQTLAPLRTAGKKIGLCSGGFDFLHPGHITYLEEAKKCCDILVVAVAHDAFVARKGKGRPILPDYVRAYAIAQLKMVDYVIIDDGGTGICAIVQPDVYIKGPDHASGVTAGMLEMKEALAPYRTRICYTSAEKLSGTELITYIKNQIA